MIVSTAVLLMVHCDWQPRNDQFTRTKLRVVLVIQLILLVDLLERGSHPGYASLVYLLLQHALIVLEIHRSLLEF